MDHDIWETASERCSRCGAYYRPCDICADCGRCIDCVAVHGHTRAQEYNGE